MPAGKLTYQLAARPCYSGGDSSNRIPAFWRSWRLRGVLQFLTAFILQGPPYALAKTATNYCADY
jgi:hypothetical protein